MSDEGRGYVLAFLWKRQYCNNLYAFVPVKVARFIPRAPNDDTKFSLFYKYAVFLLF